MTDRPDEVFLNTPQEWSTRAWHDARPGAEHEKELAHRPRLELAATVTANAVLELGADGVLDVGAGAGGLLVMIAAELARLGLDDVAVGGIEWHAPSRERAAGKGIRLVDGDVTALAVALRLPCTDRTVVVATELVEHLENPHGFIRDLYADERIVGIVISSPHNETARYFSEGHRWAWTDAGYRQLVAAAGWQPAYQAAAGPFQVLYANRGGVSAHA